MGGAAGNLVGQTIGNHKVVARLGEGGMGVVYLAEHVLLGRKAAIKVLHPEFSQRPDVVNRFFNEARASSLLKHPAIIDIYDFGNLPDQSAYIVMEFLEGEALATRLGRLQTLPPQDAVAIIHQMAKALGAAHARGIVHRDLKPDNVYIVPDPENPGRERIKVLDFGIAKLSDEAGGAGKKTRTGALLGTPVYMSPEQCEGAGYVDHRSDIYSMGILLYEMLCGQVPFMAEGFGKILAMHMHLDPTPPRDLDPRIPREVEALVLHMLVKDKTQRYQSCDAVATAIEEVVASVELYGDAGLSAGSASTFRVPAPTGMSRPPTGPGPAFAPVPPSAVATAPGRRGPVQAGTAPIQALTTPLTAAQGVSTHTPTAVLEEEEGRRSAAAAGAAAAGVGRLTTLSGGATSTQNPAGAGAKKGLVLGVAAVLALGVAGGVGYFAFGGNGAGEDAETDGEGEVARETATGKVDVKGARREEESKKEGARVVEGEGSAGTGTASGSGTASAAGTASASGTASATGAGTGAAMMAKPGIIHFAFASRPGKAKVYRLPGNELVGETPCRIPSEAGVGDVDFVLRKPGFADARVTMSAVTGGEKSTKLKKAKDDDGSIKPVGRGEGDLAPVR